MQKLVLWMVIAFQCALDLNAQGLNKKKQFFDSIKVEQQYLWSKEVARRKDVYLKYRPNKEDSVSDAERRQAFMKKIKNETKRSDSHRRISVDSILLMDLRNRTVLDLNHTLMTQVPSSVWEIDTVLLAYNNLDEVQFADKSEIIFFDLSGNQISTLSFVTNESLQHLGLSENQLNRVPKSINKLKSLKILELNGNDYSNSKLRFKRNTHLEELNLSNTNLKKLPRSISKLRNLKRLYLNNNELTSLKQIRRLKYLEELEVSQNIISIDPSELVQFGNLKKLSMNKCFLIHLPKEIGQLKSLEELVLAENQITLVPDQVQNLSKLKSLVLYKNKLTGLPEGIYEMDSLRDLDLYFNKIRNIDSKIGNLINLQRLFLAHNELEELPEEIGSLSQLTELYVHHNKLIYIPDLSGLVDLRYLHAQSNSLVEFPNSVLELHQLEELNLSDNLISEIPASIALLTQLTGLYINNVGLDRNSAGLSELYHALQTLKEAGVSVETNFKLTK